MTRFMAVGECMIEMSPREDGGYSLGFAGDTFNTAWYARKLAPLSTRIAYLSAIGDDEASTQMRQFIENAGIAANLSVRPGGAVGLYLVSLKDGERSFSYWRSTSAARSLADDLEALPQMSKGDMVLFSGITIAILPPDGRARLLDVLSRARAEGVQVAFDPNLRPRLWPSTDEMCHWISRAAEVSDICLPSFEDEADFFNDADQQVTADRYAKAGASLVVVKDGPNPILIQADTETYSHTPTPIARPVDTTAAGDSFNAGFLMALINGSHPRDAAAAGSAVSAQVVAQRGALVEITA